MSTSLRNKAVKRVSCSDLLRIEPFNNLTEYDLINPKNESTVFAVLYALGIDTNNPVHVQACQHRNLYKQVVLGYSFVGNERTDEKWLSSRYASLDARIASNRRDPELQSDMIKSSTEGIPYSVYKDLCSKAGGMEGTTQDIKPMEVLETCKDVQEVMRELQEQQIKIRGSINPMEEDMLNTI